MIVEEIMKKEVITLNPEDTIERALRLFSKHHIRHLPIVDEDNMVIGIVSDRDVRDASPSIFFKGDISKDLQIPITSIMTINVITAHPLDVVEEVSAILYEHEIGCLPVTKQGKLVGIITAKDLLYTLIQLTGANQPSSQIEVKVQNVAGMLTEVAGIICKRGVNIISVLVYPAKTEEYKVLVFRIQTMNPNAIIQELQHAGYDVLWPNLPGIDSN